MDLCWSQGKGEMRTFWLLGKEGGDPPEPAAPVAPGQGSSAASLADATNTGSTEPPAARDELLATLCGRGGVVSDEASCLLADGVHDNNANSPRRYVAAAAHNGSCLSLFHECKRNLLKELRRDYCTRPTGYRSAPVIVCRDRPAVEPC